MVFSSLNFLFIFLPITLLLYFILPERLKNLVLLIASIIFYAWGEPVYVILMLLSILFNYFSGLQLSAARNDKKRKKQLVLSIIVNLLLLGFFKYFGFLISTFNAIFGSNIASPELSLPIGISFYTFQALSYVIDVYRKNVRTQKNIINFAMYITMFPQLIAGPIVKYSDIENQITNRRITLSQAGEGVERLVLGLAKKVLLANNLGLLYTTIQAADERSFLTAWLGAAAYTMQIYFDFSGYSDMAIGMGKMLGFDFPENFNYPYLAKSITDFWRRWHITLSSWFRDYLYIPLGGNRVAPVRHILNIFIVWMLTGLWHGAGWNFVLWGVYYGIILILEKYVLTPLCKNFPTWIKHIYTIILVMLGWVIFSNTDFACMGTYLSNLFGSGTIGLVDADFWYYLKSNLILIVLSIIACSPAFKNLFIRITQKKAAAALVITIVLLLLCVAFLVFGSYNPFLYFRF